MFVIERRPERSTLFRIVSPALAVLTALVFGALFLKLSGFDPLAVYGGMWRGAFGDAYGLSETLVKAIPIALCALGITVAFRMNLWNIGAEGQLYAGAMAATGVALSFPETPAPLLLTAMAAAGMAAGALWALLSAVPRAWVGANEILTTLMLNYVAVFLAEYLIHGPWKDPASFNFPLSPAFSETARLPAFGDTRVHAGLLFALAAAAALTAALRKTKWGYELRLVGANPAVATYAGIGIGRHILVAMAVGGAMAGLAGMTEVSAITGRLQYGLSPGYGYSAIIVAWLAKLSPAGILVMSFLFGGLLVGGYAVQFIGVPAAAVNMLQGAMLFFWLAAEFFGQYRVAIRGRMREVR
jgi:simple sugar transport system permease protein